MHFLSFVMMQKLSSYRLDKKYIDSRKVVVKKSF